ncbi:chromophore lyase CpcT/CpeT [Leptolyngbya sp. AN02str]|uniref:chromophore lyase CpcT/CpeT n=1 Tax=Leptolyngbya sp. AN02str TaxID=3423363 RepID=UPI003D3226E8
MSTPSVTTLAQWLAGTFNNKAQAMEQPTWFVHLQLWHRPLPFRLNGHLAIFAEQANALYPTNAYRQRILVLQEAIDGTPSRVQYYAFRQAERVIGAGADPERLRQLSPNDLELLPGCGLNLTLEATACRAIPNPEDKCCFQYAGETRQVVLGFEAGQGWFKSYDRGVDPATGKSLWGAILGPYEFTKCEDFSAELPT